MVLPDDLLRLAALGTNQIAKNQQAQSEQPEVDLLLQVLKLKLQQQGGYQPAKMPEPSLQPAPIETAHPCNSRAVRQLLLMLVAEKHTHLLPAWLDEMVAANQCLPAEVLPLLMTHGAYHKKLRDQLLPVIGARGKWLAQVANHKDWQWVLNQDVRNFVYDEKTMRWDKDFKQYRLANSDEARETLLHHWANIEVKDRDTLIADMKHGLTASDVPFLLTLLDDEWLGILAARLLAALPDTELHQEVWHTAKDLLIIEPMGRKSLLVIDFAWADMFIGHSEYKSRHHARNVSKRFHDRWTPEQILSLIPLSYWCERWHVTPATLVEGARNSTNPTNILDAWVRVADFYDDHMFAYELLRQMRPNRLRPQGRHIVINMLTADEKEDIAIFWLDQAQSSIDENHPAQYILKTIERQWSSDLMLTFLANLERSFSNTVRPLLRPPLRALLEKVVTYFSLDMVDEVKRVLQLNQRAELTEAELEVMDGIVSGLGFHQEIVQAIRYREA